MFRIKDQAVIARFDGPDPRENFKASIAWAKANGYNPGEVVCGPEVPGFPSPSFTG